MTPITQAITTLQTTQERRHAWLLKSGEQARRLNRESRLDNWTVEVTDLGDGHAELRA